MCYIIFQLYISNLRQPSRVRRAQLDTKLTATVADAISNQSTISLFSGTKHESNLLTQVLELWVRAMRKTWPYRPSYLGRYRFVCHHHSDCAFVRSSTSVEQRATYRRRLYTHPSLPAGNI